MFNKFADYMYYLLTAPFKKVKKASNQWYILFKVLGKRFDDAMDGFYDAREQSMVATCDPVMLPVHAEDRGMKKYPGESDENFRVRISNYAEVMKLGGSDVGVKLAVKTLGFESVNIINAKKLKNDELRWAEFYVIINVNPDEELPIGYDVLRYHVRKVKYVTAKDNYLFIVCLSADNTSNTENTEARYISTIPVNNKCMKNERLMLRCEAVNDIPNFGLHLNVKNDLWYFDGSKCFDGSRMFDAYETQEDL